MSVYEEPAHEANDNDTGSKDRSDVIIPAEAEELLEGLPEPQRKAVKAILLGVSHQRLLKGPLPPPDILKEYNDAFPNGAERIFLEAQKQTNHRLELEKRVIPEEQKQSGRGQIFRVYYSTVVPYCIIYFNSLR